MVTRVDDVDVAVRGGGDAERVNKLAVAGTIRTPITEEGTDGREVLDAPIAVIGYVDVTGGRVYLDAGYPPKLADARTVGTPFT